MLDEDEMCYILHKTMVIHVNFLLFCISAERNMGIGRLMSFIDNVEPSPLDTNPIHAVVGKEYLVNPNDKTTMLVIKTHIKPHVGDFLYFKVLRVVNVWNCF